MLKNKKLVAVVPFVTLKRVYVTIETPVIRIYIDEFVRHQGEVSKISRY